MVALSTFTGKGIVPFKLRRRMMNTFVTTSASTQRYHAQTPPNTSFVKRGQGEKKTSFAAQQRPIQLGANQLFQPPSFTTLFYPTCISKTCHSLNTPPHFIPLCHCTCWAAQNTLCFQEIVSCPTISSSNITSSVKHSLTKNELVRDLPALSFPWTNCTMSPVVLHCLLFNQLFAHILLFLAPSEL